MKNEIPKFNEAAPAIAITMQLSSEVIKIAVEFYIIY